MSGIVVGCITEVTVLIVLYISDKYIDSPFILVGLALIATALLLIIAVGIMAVLVWKCCQR